MSLIFGREYSQVDQSIIDLRSDVVTRQTPEMKDEMFRAKVGNDGWGEDPTVNTLQQKFAEMTGKEDALFVPSGSMGNLLALLCCTERGDEVIVDKTSHIYQYGVAAASVVGGIQFRCIDPVSDGFITTYDIETNLRLEGFQYPKTKMVCFENPHNIRGGIVYPPELFRKTARFCREKNLLVHMDGSRLFNAAVTYRCSIREWTDHADTLISCLSKSLGCPMGSLLAGDGELIEKARHYRRMLGGHMRQSGYMAAAGLYAFNNNINRLEDDHRKAKRFADYISRNRYLTLSAFPQTNMVVFSVLSNPGGITNWKLIDIFMSKNIYLSVYSGSEIRAVFHMDISEENLDFVLQTFTEVLS